MEKRHQEKAMQMVSPGKGQGNRAVWEIREEEADRGHFIAASGNTALGSIKQVEEAI